MSVNISELYKRYTSLEQEVSYIQRKRKEEAEQAVRVLQTLTDSDIELLKDDIPDILEVKSFTVDGILANKNGELQRLQRLYSSVTELLDKWIRHYEDGLC